MSELVRPGEGSPAEIVLFSNAEFRIEIQDDGNGSFRVLAPPVARQLGYRDAARMLETVPDAEKGYTLASTPGGQQRVSYLTEGGFYRVFGQRQAARVVDRATRAYVERFQSWVFNEVLPKLRRGELVPAEPAQPSMPAVPTTFAEALRLAADKAEEAEAERSGRIAAESQRDALAPAAHLWETLVQADGDYLVGDAAKVLQNDFGVDTGPQRLFGQMEMLGWVYRTTENSRWRAKQTAISTGRLREKLVTREDHNTGARIGAPPQVRVTHKGIEDLHKALTGRASQLALLPGGAS